MSLLESWFLTDHAFNHETPIMSFAKVPSEHYPKYPYGNESKFMDPNPGTVVHQYYKHLYYVKPTYYFMHGIISKLPFCTVSIVINGDREALEFAEKSFDLGKKHFKLNRKYKFLLTLFQNIL